MKNIYIFRVSDIHTLYKYQYIHVNVKWIDEDRWTRNSSHPCIVHPRAICSSIGFYHLIIHLNNNTLTRVKRRKVKSTCDLMSVKSGLCELLQLLHTEHTSSMVSCKECMWFQKSTETNTLQHSYKCIVLKFKFYSR